jgi:hypothetical protein
VTVPSGSKIRAAYEMILLGHTHLALTPLAEQQDMRQKHIIIIMMEKTMMLKKNYKFLSVLAIVAA